MAIITALKHIMISIIPILMIPPFWFMVVWAQVSVWLRKQIKKKEK